MNKFVQQLISYAMVALNLEYDQRKFNNTKICRKNKRRYFVIQKKKKKKIMNIPELRRQGSLKSFRLHIDKLYTPNFKITMDNWT